MNPIEERLHSLEARVDTALSVESRLRALEKGLEEPTKARTSPLKEWLSALAPFASSLALLLVGYGINDSVKAALAREQLDLDNVKDMRDVMKDFNQSAAQPDADANAIALSMYGKHALAPLIAGLEGGDVTHLAAEKGLLLAAVTDRAAVCPRLGEIIEDGSARYTWQTHKSTLHILGQATCKTQIAALTAYKQALEPARSDNAGLARFARRYSDGDTFEVDAAASLYNTATSALEHLKSAAGTP